MRDYDAIVIGGGHAGIEASLSLSREGYETLMITQSLDAIGRMSCNPAIGGLAKGNLVREIDALGGEMGHLIDSTMIQFRILNRSRGPAVQAPRAQADKFSYSRLAKETCEREKKLHLFMDTVIDFILEEKDGKKTIVGVVTKRGWRISAKVVVLTTGTFMEGRIFIGEYDAPSGRLGEEAALGLGMKLREYGFNVGRMKTGTPARVRASSLNYDEMGVQEGDEVMRPFSFDNEKIDRVSLACYITYTNEETHRIIRENIHRSPLYGGKIVGKGPRYCPSIEDKVVRFPERERHQIFVEPEGIGTEEMYLNGLSSSLPEEVQHSFIRTLPGLRECEIMRPAYAVEYDYLDPLDLYASLESKIVRNLFVAGQTNGTSGYEEAASQGLMAGLNACSRLKGERAVVLGRTDAYIGVLIDDLVTKGTKEPYRMFTSRAEYRLSLRHDTADIRLTPIGYKAGLCPKEKYDRLMRKIESMDEVKELLRAKREGGKNALERLVESGVDIYNMDDIPELKNYSDEVLSEVMLEAKYSGYLKRQEIDAQRAKKQESILIPEDFDYDTVDGLSAESREKFKAVRPSSVGMAGRISGVRVSDTAILALHLSERKRNEDERV